MKPTLGPPVSTHLLQPAAPSFRLQLPPQEEGEQWWVETDPEQVPPKDTQGVVLFGELELGGQLLGRGLFKAGCNSGQPACCDASRPSQPCISMCRLKAAAGCTLV